LIGQNISALAQTDIKAATPDDLDDGYNKALRSGFGLRLLFT